MEHWEEVGGDWGEALDHFKKDLTFIEERERIELSEALK